MFKFRRQSTRAVLSVTIPSSGIAHDVIAIQPVSDNDYHQRPLDQRCILLKLRVLNELKDTYQSRKATVQTNYTMQASSTFTVMEKVHQWRLDTWHLEQHHSHRCFLDEPDVPLSPLSDIPSRLNWDGENYVSYHSSTGAALHLEGLCELVSPSAVTTIEYPLVDLSDLMVYSSPNTPSSPKPYLHHLPLNLEPYDEFERGQHPSSTASYASDNILMKSEWLPEIEDEDEDTSGYDTSEYGDIGSSLDLDDRTQFRVETPTDEPSPLVAALDIASSSIDFLYFWDEDLLSCGVDLREASMLKNKFKLLFASAPEVEDASVLDYEGLQNMKLVGTGI